MRRTRLSLGVRIYLLEVGILALGFAMMLGLVLLVGPETFDRHMAMVEPSPSPDLRHHARHAFEYAVVAALATAAAGTVLLASLVHLFVGRRLEEQMSGLVAAAERLTGGDYDARVPRTSQQDFGRLADALSTLGGRIGATERIRRQMLTDLAHEMRTPITTIDVTVEAVEDGVLPPGPEAAAIVRAQTARLDRLVADIREVSAAEEGRLAVVVDRVRLDELVARHVAAVQPACQLEGTTLQVVRTEAVAVRGDAARLGQVLDNVLGNARRHARGGRIEVEVRAGADVAEVVVTDDGDGIAPADLPLVFERFYQGERRDRHAGSGVGLAISRALVRAHGGTITAESGGVGEGATFRIALPRITPV